MAIEIKGETVSTWSGFMQLCTTEFVDRWHFRGALENWALETALERAARVWGVPLEELPEIEKGLLREFKRAYPPDETVLAPDDNDTVGWFALMQHHGAPTRFLDWTYSPFVAAFFALDDLLRTGDPKRNAVVWALSHKPVAEARTLVTPAGLEKAFLEYAATRDGAPFRAVFLEADPPITFASIVNPYRLHQRLVLQQGVFLCPGNIRQTFEENLLALPGVLHPGNLRKILLPHDVLSDAFRSLRAMNITHATLFPGVDGFARSLRHRIDFLRSPQLRSDAKY
ncbi:MAG TPA: FRG domain-containing protein [Candidatus Binatia bacterium]|nr:FRG domain-containing protein [Candidatus Binatia bacterium]